MNPVNAGLPGRGDGLRFCGAPVSCSVYDDAVIDLLDVRRHPRRGGCLRLLAPRGHGAGEYHCAAAYSNVNLLGRQAEEGLYAVVDLRCRRFGLNSDRVCDGVKTGTESANSAFRSLALIVPVNLSHEGQGGASYYGVDCVRNDSDLTQDALHLRFKGGCSSDHGRGGCDHGTITIRAGTAPRPTRSLLPSSGRHDDLILDGGDMR